MPNNQPMIHHFFNPVMRRLGRLSCVTLVICLTASPVMVMAQQNRPGQRPGAGKQPARANPPAAASERAPAEAPAEAPAYAPEAASDSDVAAERLVKSAEDLLLAREYDRGVRMLETVIERFPDSPVRFKAYLALGRHFVNIHRENDALKFLRYVQVLEKPDEPLRGDAQETFLEAIYLMGIGHYQLGQYAAAFPLLRKITRDYPNTVWANQAYYYIGMSHFMQGKWQQAIDALSLVGTFVDPVSPTTQYVEAGRRLYIKVEDPDLPILNRLGQEITVTVQTSSGDKEIVHCVPLAGKGELQIGSIPTEVGAAKPGDNVLQVVAGDVITTTYLDNNTQDGEKDLPRTAAVRVVSTGSLEFTLGTFESKAPAAFLGQPLFILLQDADLDVSEKADTVQIKVISRYRDREAEDLARDQLSDLERMMAAGEEIRRYTNRDEVVVTLTELGEGAVVRSGRFAGRVQLLAEQAGQPASADDAVLMAVTGDEVIATYVDELHIAGDSAREVTASLTVAGEIENRPMATQYVVADPVVRARKNLVEATAYLELARIFKSMGLNAGAAERCDLGLAQIEDVIRSREQIPNPLTEEAFQLKWNLEIVKEDFEAAITTCQLFNRLFPDSPIVDQALLGIGRIHQERGDWARALAVFQRVLALPQSLAKAEAQFRIAETVEAQGLAASPPNQFAAIPHYKQVAERYPDSQFAGEALGKLIDYHVLTKDYAQAEDLLNQIFQDHPDAQFLDAMLLKWVVVAYNMGNFQKAQEKCSQLLFEYPESPFAERAKGLLPRIEERIRDAAGQASAS
jgi:TolA-binding protein